MPASNALLGPALTVRRRSGISLMCRPFLHQGWHQPLVPRVLQMRCWSGDEYMAQRAASALNAAVRPHAVPSLQSWTAVAAVRRGPHANTDRSHRDTLQYGAGVEGPAAEHRRRPAADHVAASLVAAETAVSLRVALVFRHAERDERLRRIDAFKAAARAQYAALVVDATMKRRLLVVRGGLHSAVARAGRHGLHAGQLSLGGWPHRQRYGGRRHQATCSGYRPWRRSARGARPVTVRQKSERRVAPARRAVESILEELGGLRRPVGARRHRVTMMRQRYGMCVQRQRHANQPSDRRAASSDRRDAASPSRTLTRYVRSARRRAATRRRHQALTLEIKPRSCCAALRPWPDSASARTGRLLSTQRAIAHLAVRLTPAPDSVKASKIGTCALCLGRWALRPNGRAGDLRAACFGACKPVATPAQTRVSCKCGEQSDALPTRA